MDPPLALLRRRHPSRTGDQATPVDPQSGDGPNYREQMDAFERNLLASALSTASGNQSEAARRLGLSRATLYDRLQRYGLLSEGGKKD